jgi:hypothetical protein
VQSRWCAGDTRIDRVHAFDVRADPAPSTGTSLESKAQTETRGIDALLAGAISWRLIERREDGRWQRAVPEPEIAAPLEQLLRLTRKVSDEPIPSLPKRRYRSR